MTKILYHCGNEWEANHLGEVEVECDGCQYIWITKEELQEMLDAINEQQEQDNESN